MKLLLALGKINWKNRREKNKQKVTGNILCHFTKAVPHQNLFERIYFITESNSQRARVNLP